MSDKIREAQRLALSFAEKSTSSLTANAHIRGLCKLLDVALAQQPAHAVPDGWKLVPAVPTQEQNDAGRAVLVGGAVPMAKVYRAMLSAAPAAPVAVQEPVATLTVYSEGSCKLIDFDGAKAAFSLPDGTFLPLLLPLR